MTAKDLECALDFVCKLIDDDNECPFARTGIEPWPETCEVKCKRLSDAEHWQCWKQYFLNKARESKVINREET